MILSHHALLLRSVPPLVGPGALVGGGGDDTFAGKVGELLEDPASDMFVCATSRTEQYFYDPWAPAVCKSPKNNDFVRQRFRSSRKLV